MSSSDAPTAAGSGLSKSEVSAGTSDWALKRLPAAASPPPPSRLPRNWTELAMIETAWRLPEPSFASHSRQSSRPSTATGRPLDR